MPRGLGDDPLSRERKRSGSASSTNVTNDPATRTVAQSAPAVAAASQTSHNDVFFRRRAEESQAVPVYTPEQREVANLGEATTVTEVPEIAEIVDIVRIAEVAQSTQSVQVPRAERVAELVATVDPQSSITGEPPAVVSTASQAEVSIHFQPEHRRSRRFFKRLLGRFAK